MKKDVSPRRILILCFIGYVLAYLMRLNLSVVIPYIKTAEGYTNAQMGSLTGFFFLSYTCGQLLNGMIGDRVSAKIMVPVGLCGSALCSLACALTHTPLWLSIFWTVNGYFQSMLWGPMVKTLSRWYPAEKLSRVSYIMALSCVAGYVTCWGLASFLGSHFGWRTAFLAPLVPVAVYLALFLLLFRNRPENHVSAPSSGKKAEPAAPLLPYLLKIRFPVLFLVSAVTGILREGIGVWLPTVLEESGLIPSGTLWMVLLVIPLLNFAGTTSVQSVLRHNGQNSSLTLGLVLSLMAVLALVLKLSAALQVMVILMLVLILASANGITQILVSLIPFQNSSDGRVSFTASVLDFSIYCGAAFSTAMTGRLSDGGDWTKVYLFWLIAAGVGTLSAWLWHTMKITSEKKEISQ